MSIIITGLNMPTERESFNLTIKYNGTVLDMETGMQVAEAYELLPHGRLGDLDELVDRLTDLERTTKEYNPPDDIHGFNNGLLCGISNVIGEIRYYTPTIIEAEEE